MTWTEPSVKTFIDATMVSAFFGSAATAPFETWAESFLGSTNPNAPVTYQQVVSLGAALGASPIFHALYNGGDGILGVSYAPMSDAAFVDAVALQLTGGPLPSALHNAFLTNLTTNEAYYTVDEARGITAAMLAEGFLGASASDVAADPTLTTMWQTAKNKTAVSEYYAAASANNPFLLPTTLNGSDQAWTVSHNVVGLVSNNPFTVTSAEHAIDQAVAAQSLAPLTLPGFGPSGGGPNAIGLV